MQEDPFSYADFPPGYLPFFCPTIFPDKKYTEIFCSLRCISVQPLQY